MNINFVDGKIEKRIKKYAEEVFNNVCMSLLSQVSFKNNIIKIASLYRKKLYATINVHSGEKSYVAHIQFSSLEFIKERTLNGFTMFDDLEFTKKSLFT